MTSGKSTPATSYDGRVRNALEAKRAGRRARPAKSVASGAPAAPETPAKAPRCPTCAGRHLLPPDYLSPSNRDQQGVTEWNADQLLQHVLMARSAIAKERHPPSKATPDERIAIRRRAAAARELIGRLLQAVAPFDNSIESRRLAMVEALERANSPVIGQSAHALRPGAVVGRRSNFEELRVMVARSALQEQIPDARVSDEVLKVAVMAWSRGTGDRGKWAAILALADALRCGPEQRDHGRTDLGEGHSRSSRAEVLRVQVRKLIERQSTTS